MVSQANIFMRRYTTKLNYDNKKSNNELIGEFKIQSFIECSVLCQKDCFFFGYNAETKKCRTHRNFYLSTMSEETGWRYYSPDLENLALGMTVSFSTASSHSFADPSYVIDGRFGPNNPLLFHSDFELHPWLTIALGQLSIVKNVILYNRNAPAARWLHSVEIRVGTSSVWSEMKICGSFDGPSQAGQIHTIECETQPVLYGSYVTVKIVQPNYITDDWNARDGKNALVLQEVVVNGLHA